MSHGSSFLHPPTSHLLSALPKGRAQMRDRPLHCDALAVLLPRELYQAARSSAETGARNVT